MVDPERLRRVLQRVTDDLDSLETYARRPAEDVTNDAASLGHVKYLFVTAIEGCIDAAHHVAASEGWSPAETNAGAMEVLGRHGALDRQLTETMVAAVRFRNLLVHRYAEVDDRLTVEHLREVTVLRRFVAAMVALADQR
ncbi:MAG: DUF86 domain-containing protein [Actinobacteria bacterium]|nr:DUF86 domain-containing protein [Actinomycetota bacterium]